MPEAARQKITFAKMRAAGVRGLLIYCSDYRYSHSVAISVDQWPDDVRLSNLEPRFVCKACGKRGADVRPDFNLKKAGQEHFYRQCGSPTVVALGVELRGEQCEISDDAVPRAR